MPEIDDRAEASKDCARCGSRALYWRTAVVAGGYGFPGPPQARPGSQGGASGPAPHRVWIGSTPQQGQGPAPQARGAVLRRYCGRRAGRHLER
jgi:hypothetical protein